jgi:MerR family copper efflux transcriptional regulator
MNIGQAATASGVSAKMIRYYERIGLVQPAERTDGNYRNFGPREVDELRFISRVRGLGFTVQEITDLLSLWRDRARPSAEVKAIVDTHVADLEARIAEMRVVAETLRDLAASCTGDERPESPTWSKLPPATTPGRHEAD